MKKKKKKKVVGLFLNSHSTVASSQIYEELGDAFSHKKDEVLIVKVDADEHSTLGSRYGIEGFPTLKWFPNGINSDPEDYSGGRDLDSLASFVTKKSGNIIFLLSHPSPDLSVSAMLAAQADTWFSIIY